MRDTARLKTGKNRLAANPCSEFSKSESKTASECVSRMMTEIPRKWNRVISLFFFMEHPQGPASSAVRLATHFRGKDLKI